MQSYFGLILVGTHFSMCTYFHSNQMLCKTCVRTGSPTTCTSNQYLLSLSRMNVKNYLIPWYKHIVRLPPGRKGVLSPNHVTPVFFDNLDLKDSEKLGVTFWIHSFLLENLEKVLKNHNFLEKLENLYSLMVVTKYYWTGYVFIPNKSSFYI